MRVTTKGQVTIPQEVRKKLGIFPGTEVEFIVNGNSANLVKAKNSDSRSSRGKRLVALLADSATDRSLGLTTDEILLLTRGDD